jgi:CMP-N,N'-diacetyllegionaminic acid synthase
LINGKSIIGLIPARYGSRGLPGKNILPLLGKPLIAWTIEQALSSRYIDRLIVSTDSNEIATVSVGYGAEVPFLRPAELSSDTAKGIDVVLHVIRWMEEKDLKYDLLFNLQPTSPARTSEDIDCAAEMLFEKNAKSIISVCQMDHPLSWVNTLPLDGCMKDFVTAADRNVNRQDLPLFYRINGAIYLAYVEYLKKNGSFLGKKTYAQIMPPERSVDIDSKFDFLFAEFLLKERHSI